MSELIERLREADLDQRAKWPVLFAERGTVLAEAADEIERLREALQAAVDDATGKPNVWFFKAKDALASVDTHPKGGDAVAAPFMGGAVPEGQTPNQEHHP